MKRSSFPLSEHCRNFFVRRQQTWLCLKYTYVIFLLNNLKLEMLSSYASIPSRYVGIGMVF